MSPTVSGRVPKPDPLVIRLIREMAKAMGGELDLDDPDTEEAIAVWLSPRVAVIEDALEDE